MDANLIKSLFLRHQVLVDITAASYNPATQVGEYGWINPIAKSVFSEGLCHALTQSQTADADGNQDGTVEWNEFFPVVKEAVNAGFQSLKECVRDGMVKLTPNEIGN